MKFNDSNFQQINRMAFAKHKTETRSSLFCDVTQCRSIDNRRFGTVHALSFLSVIALRWFDRVCPETSVTTKGHFVTSQKSEGLSNTPAEA